MSNLMLHCGGKAVNREGLDLIPMPDKTATYSPVSHFDLTKQVLEVSQDLLKGFTLDRESYGIAREGSQMFGLVVFKNGDAELGLSIGFRNSYDKSMSVGLACGASVFVCDNMALRGSIQLMRKHTGNAWEELTDRLVGICYKATKTYDAISQDKDTLKQIELTDQRAFQVMGELYGQDILSPRQLSVVKAEWLKPSHDAFQPRNAWSLYNAGTEALKTSPPSVVMENHVNLSQWFNDNIIELAPIQFNG